MKKRQFFNADTPETSAIFSGLHSKTIEQKQETREEEKPINPFAHIDEGNKLLEHARLEAAKLSDATQIFVNGPVTRPQESETVSLDDLPAIVRQAAEAAVTVAMNRRKKNR
jgi:hypothetical protein